MPGAICHSQTPLSACYMAHLCYGLAAGGCTRVVCTAVHTVLYARLICQSCMGSDFARQLLNMNAALYSRTGLQRPCFSNMEWPLSTVCSRELHQQGARCLTCRQPGSTSWLAACHISKLAAVILAAKQLPRQPQQQLLAGSIMSSRHSRCELVS